jgi:hypothetical protein
VAGRACCDSADWRGAGGDFYLGANHWRTLRYGSFAMDLYFFAWFTDSSCGGHDRSAVVTANSKCISRECAIGRASGGQCTSPAFVGFFCHQLVAATGVGARRAGDAATSLACVQVSHVDLTQFLRTNGQTVLMLGGAPILRCSYNVDWGHIENDDEISQAPLIRRFKVVARGSILLVIGQSQRLLTVDRLAGHAWVTFVPVPKGYRLTMRVAIEDAEAELITLPFVGDARPMLMKQLEAAANDGLIDGLEKVVLPSWFPTDLRADILVH